MTIEETNDLDLLTVLINHPDVQEVMGLPGKIDFANIWRERMTMLLFRDAAGEPIGFIWLDMQLEGGVEVPVAHVAFTKALRGRTALKAITGAINWCFLNKDWPTIWAKAPFRRSHMLLKMLDWEDVRVDVETFPILGTVHRHVMRLSRETWYRRIAHRPFFVTGFPRSGTAWCANLLTSGGALCPHEVTQWGPGGDIWMYSSEYRGTADPSILVTTTMVQDNLDAPVVWIRRDRAAAEKSFEAYTKKAGIEIPDGGIHALFDRIETAAGLALVGRQNVLVVDFDNLFTVESAEKIWKHCLPKLPFDRVRAKILCGMNVQQDLRRAWNHQAPNPLETEEKPDMLSIRDDRRSSDIHKDLFTGAK